MTWHETIELIRKDPEYAALVELSYFDADLALNVERFGQSEEFEETLRLIREMHPAAKTILEIGAGNGVSTINFALLGYHVTAVEPDDSTTVGARAIETLAGKYNLNNIRVFQKYAEEIEFPNESFDLVYVRQAMHHAQDLDKFIKESARVLKKGGFLFTVRDHVIFDAADKEWFFQNHPLHKFYGGENAFTPDEYKNAFNKAGLTILKEFKYYDNVINYFPLKRKEMMDKIFLNEGQLKDKLRRKISFLADFPFVFRLYKARTGFSKEDAFHSERKIPGRMYSYIATRP